MAIKTAIVPVLVIMLLAAGFYLVQEGDGALPGRSALVEIPPELEPTAEDNAAPYLDYGNGLTARALQAMEPEAGTIREVNVYSTRKEGLLTPLFDAYAEKHGVVVNFITGDAADLVKRLQREAEHTPADILLTADIAVLQQAKETGMLAGSAKDWVALSRQPHVLAYNRRKVKPEQLSGYADLAGPQWKGRVLVRRLENEADRALLASMLAAYGPDKAQEWVKGVMANLAAPAFTDDTALLKALAAGEGDIALVDTTALGALLVSPKKEERKLAEHIGIFFPEQENSGTCVSISGAGVTTHAPHPQRAKQLLEYLASVEGQTAYADLYHEYPANEEYPRSAVVESWGAFKQDTRPVDTIGAYYEEAGKLAEAGGWPQKLAEQATPPWIKR